MGIVGEVLPRRETGRMNCQACGAEIPEEMVACDDCLRAEHEAEETNA